MKNPIRAVIEWVRGFDLVYFESAALWNFGQVHFHSLGWRRVMTTANKKYVWFVSLLLIAGTLVGCDRPKGEVVDPTNTSWFCFNGWAYAVDPVSVTAGNGGGHGTWPIFDADGKPMACAKWRAQQPK